ncbi:MAG: helix-turn-helix transcriptional regulator [Clostridiales bacterium]|nr:helix-turn-helix transcriptional regulator [Clostridiales bacterium]
MTNRRSFIYPAIIATCFLYAGSVYMSQFYRLIDVCDGETVDLITSCGNYICQALGLIAFMIGFRFLPKVFGNKRAFAVLIMVGTVFMILSQLSPNTNIIIWAGYLFNIHTGLCFGFYLTQYAAKMCPAHIAIFYGIAYSIGSLGTYLLSLPQDGEFLKSTAITVLYFVLAVITAVLAILSDNIPADTDNSVDRKNVSQISAIVIIMTIISVNGSGLYYSLPQAADVNWNLIRCFYAAGLVLTGIVMDKDRRIGEILTAVSLVYPLIVAALIGEGVTGTVTMGLSYLFRGCLTIYYVIFFVDLYARNSKTLFLAPLGLCLSRIVEAVLSYFMVAFQLSNLVHIIITAVFFVPLIILVIIRQTGGPRAAAAVPDAAPVDETKRKALFAEQYSLTAREAEILDLIHEGLTDDEISAKINISRNTVRFHVSNILKKTGTSSRVEVSRALDKF